LGVRGNFGQAIRLCTGDIVALADQDDVWLPEKIKRCASLLSEDEHVGLVFTDAEVVDENLNSLGYGLWESVGFNEQEKKVFRKGRPLDVLLSHNVVTGSTILFRAKFINVVLPIPETYYYWSHDCWIGAVISAVSEVRFLDARLLYYRQHAGQQVGAQRPSLRVGAADTSSFQRRGQASRDFSGRMGHLQGLYVRLASRGGAYQDAAAMIESNIHHLTIRRDMPQKRICRIPVIASEIANLHYHRYSRGLLGAAKDLLLWCICDWIGPECSCIGRLSNATVPVPRLFRNAIVMRDIPFNQGATGGAALYAIILNWNSWKNTIECVKSLQQVEGVAFSILIVDNASTDGSEFHLRERLPDVQLIQTGENLGYAGGNNVGIRYASDHGARYVLLLNPDVTVQPTTLSSLMTVVEDQPAMGAVSPVIRWKGGSQSIWFGGGVIDWLDLRTLQFEQRPDTAGFSAGAWASGCCMLISMQAIQEVGLFDEAFFLYFEETDLCQRLIAAGYDVGVCANATAFHEVNASVGLESPSAVYYMTRSALRFFSAHGPLHGVSRGRVLWRLYRRYLINRHTIQQILDGDPNARARALACLDFARRRLEPSSRPRCQKFPARGSDWGGGGSAPPLPFEVAGGVIIGAGGLLSRSIPDNAA
jgi:GT2 family glycosyltransferase